MTLGGFILTIGLVGVLRWLLDPLHRPAPEACMLLAAVAGGLAVAKVAQADGLPAALAGAPFVGMGALALAWFLLSLSDSWPRRAVGLSGGLGLAAMMLSLAVR